MPTYAIGDIQGCREQLELLLSEIQFNPVKDTLWIAGDLINRGPDSLGTLKLLYEIRDNLKIVLGNHDLHLLAASYNSKFATTKDTFHDILNHAHGQLLLNWLRKQPLLVESDDYVMCHAGIYPYWSLQQARSLAKEVETAYQAVDPEPFFTQMYGNDPEYWEQDLEGIGRLRFITNAFTRMRFMTADGALKMNYKATIDAAPEGFLPWFTMNELDWEGKSLLIGHWAALQNQQPKENLLCLDSGCVWGRYLSAYCLESKQWYQVPGVSN